MPNNNTQAFLVNAYTDPIVIKIVGRANYLNSAPLNNFFVNMFKSDKKNFIVDFSKCDGMDSTFLGIIAGNALEVRKKNGSLVLLKLNKRNLELVKNLGLHKILTVDNKSSEKCLEDADTCLKPQKLSDPKNADMILKAHQSLVKIDETNRYKFQDVITFLKSQIDEDIEL